MPLRYGRTPAPKSGSRLGGPGADSDGIAPSAPVGGSGGGGGGGGFDPGQIPESNVDFDPDTGHAHTGVDSTAVDHASLVDVTPDQHHAQSHVLATTAGLGADHTVSGLTAGQVLTATGANTAKFQAPAAGARQLLYSQTAVQAGDTIANTIFNNQFASRYTIPGNSPTVGRVYRLQARGVYSTDAITAGTLTFKIFWGSTTLVVSAAITNVVSLTNQGWFLDILITIISLGATGTVEVQGFVQLATAANTSTFAEMQGTGVVTVDTTVNKDLEIDVTWSVATASNTITQRLNVVEG